MKTFNFLIRSIFYFFLCTVIVCAGEVTTDENFLQDVTGNVRGVIKPSTKAIFTGEINARVVKLPFKEGQKFNKGDLLVKFDCTLYNAQLAAAKAEHEARKRRLENNKQLLQLNAISAIDVQISEAEADKAQADVQIANFHVSRCNILAPYDGRVVEVLVNEHESVSNDQDILSILHDVDLEIELIVPSAWLNWLREDTKFKFILDETKQEYSAKVSQIGAAVDPVSQTIRLKGVFEEEVGFVLSGMSGTALFENRN